jgi:hypothetical protein
MSSPFQLALSAGLGVAVVSAYFERRDGEPWPSVARTFFGWVVAFGLAGYLATTVGTWLLVHVF